MVYWKKYMNRKILNGIAIFLIGVFVFLSVLIGIQLITLNPNNKNEKGFSSKNPPKFHFMVVLDGTDPNYIEACKKGLDEAAEKYNVVYELWYFSGENKMEKIQRQFDMGIESNIDGIILNAFDTEAFDQTLQKANRRQIPVITIGTDIPAQEKVSFISSNPYRMGTRIGTLLQEYFEEKSIYEGTVILFQNEYKEIQDQALAIHTSLNRQFNIQRIKNDESQGNALNTVGAIQNILRQYEDIVAIVCSNGEETLGAIQALKDQNMMNDIVVIGRDDYEVILDYVERGVIHATVVVEHQKIGYKAIEEMVKYKKGEFVSQYPDISETILQREDVLRLRQNSANEIGGDHEE